jgi:CheY-like chemotaxis protein
VLVVEDVRDTADTFALLIGALGHDTRVVRESPRVMSAAREFRPDVAFLDIGMPDIDGFELARMLRAQFGNPLWICAATGYGTRADRSRAHDCGFDAYLVKPIPPACVEAMLGELALKRR